MTTEAPKMPEIVVTDQVLQEILDGDKPIAAQERRSIIEELQFRRHQAPALTGEEVIFKMRDEFLQLAKCYLDIYDYRGAGEAITMVQSLEKFEDDHIVTGIVWPARAP